MPDLNAAIQTGIDRARANGAETAVVIPGDLPLLTTEALESFINSAAGHQAAIAIAPCRRQEGTNALLLRPPNLISPRFGPASLAAHQAAAHSIGLTPFIHHAPALAFDLDTPEDWAWLTCAASPLAHLTA
jgi:2-phospho-L-lactate guanylyltransferase